MNPEAARAAPGARDYWAESRQPIYSAVLVLPFLLVYEIGLFLLGSDVINGGDAILLNLGAPLLQKFGLPGGVVSLLALVAVFAFAQYKRKGTWRIRPGVLGGLCCESLFFALLLFAMLNHLIQYFPASQDRPRPADIAAQAPAPHDRSAHDCAAENNARPELVPAARSTTARVPSTRPRDFVLYCGAGVYEELVFRVFLLGLLILVFTKVFHMEHAHAGAWSVFLGAVIFSAFHFVGDEKFEMGKFLQRAFAGLYFAAIYYNRSFGVAAASHALYDILIGVRYL